MKWECCHQRLITYTRQRREDKNEKRCRSPIRAFSVFFWITGNEFSKDTFFNSLGHIKSYPCMQRNPFFLLWQKKILSHPIIGLDNWRPMAIFFYCSRKNNSGQMTSTPKDAIFSKKKW